MEEKLIEALGSVLGLILMYLMSVVIAYLRTRLSTDRQRQLKELAELAVRFAQQVYGHLGGPQRYEKALACLLAQAQACRVPLTETRARDFIEAAVRAAKDQFGDQWGKLGQETGAETA